MGDDIEKTLKARAQHFEFFALALDETTDITNTAQLAIFIREVTSDFKIHEDLFSLEPMHGTTHGEYLLSLEPMHGTTRSEDLFEKLLGNAQI